MEDIFIRKEILQLIGKVTKTSLPEFVAWLDYKIAEIKIYGHPSGEGMEGASLPSWIMPIVQGQLQKILHAFAAMNNQLISSSVIDASQQQSSTSESMDTSETHPKKFDSSKSCESDARITALDLVSRNVSYPSQNDVININNRHMNMYNSEDEHTSDPEFDNEENQERAENLTIRSTVSDDSKESINGIACAKSEARESPSFQLAKSLSTSDSFSNIPSMLRQSASSWSKKVLRCFQCSGLFVNTEELQQHISESHDLIGTDRFICNFCGRSYGSLPTLSRHKNTEHGAILRYFCCRICGRSFKRKDLLRRHAASRHPETHLDRLLVVYDEANQNL